LPSVIDPNPVAMNPNLGMLIFSLFSLLFANIVFQAWNNQRQSKRWSKTQGTVIESSVDLNIRKTYSLNVRYTYAIDGHRYIGNRFDFYGHGYASERRAMAQQLPYLVGSTISVYYDPKKPWNAVLNRYVPIGWYLILLLMSVGMLAPVVTELRNSLVTTAIK
jgi:Protein of unknown function (DUF3592)